MVNPSIILLKETKIEATRKIYKTTGGIVAISQGASGGIATIWNEQIWASEVTFETQNWILTTLKNKDDNNIITMINIYMPNSYKDKLAAWASLSNLRNTMDLATCIIEGDLNTHLNQGEKKGGSKVRDPLSENPVDLISDWDMQDIKPIKGHYTWNNRRAGLQHIAARLDRFLINSNFLLSPLDISSQILPSAISDHKPIILSFRPSQNLGPLPFRFNQLWLDNSDIPLLVTAAWNASFSRSPNFVWESKLKTIKLALKYWAKESYSAPHKEKQDRLEQLRQIQ
jgi:exonuclease III